MSDEKPIEESLKAGGVPSQSSSNIFTCLLFVIITAIIAIAALDSCGNSVQGLLNTVGNTLGGSSTPDGSPVGGPPGDEPPPAAPTAAGFDPTDTDAAAGSSFDKGSGGDDLRKREP